eukprot:TRINITY_DN9280_c0_g1_i1.p1 TRINITY_DN9280_c0_g1~~TRINITY_DN9280_c0_g1_i1.p1  ORF type:complete len:431 (-),score=62.38 TRINITY_DN9280_c0_g1_i1:338-1630(-)
MVKLPSDQRIVIAAIGESGEGKSTLLNLLLNSPGENKIFFDFVCSEAPEACTLSPRAEVGLWRGDPNRPITVIDTPGLGSEEGPEQDLQQVIDVVKILKKFGHVDAFIIVLKSGQSRFLSQHQHMFTTFQNVFGEKFWKNSIIDVSHSCDARNKKNFDAWMKTYNKFPAATDVLSSKVFIDAIMMENETLEEFYSLCKAKEKLSYFEFESVREEMERNKQLINSSLDDISLGSDLNSDERSGMSGSRSRLDTSDDHSRPHSRISSDHSRPHSRSSVHLDLSVPISRTELPLELPRPSSRSDMHLNLPYMPPLPPRSPTLPSRRRTLPSPTYMPSRSLTSTPRLPRSFMPSFLQLMSIPQHFLQQDCREDQSVILLQWDSQVEHLVEKLPLSAIPVDHQERHLLSEVLSKQWAYQLISEQALLTNFLSQKL